MAETAPQTQASSVEDLAAQIESLLGGAQEAPAAPPPPAASPEAAAPPSSEITHDDVGKAVEQMLEEAIAKVEEIREQTDPPAPQQAAPETAAPAEKDFAAQIEDLTSLAEAATGNSPAPEIARRPAPPPPAPASPAPEHTPAPAPAAAATATVPPAAGESPNAAAHAVPAAQTPVTQAKQAEAHAPATPAKPAPPPSNAPQTHAASEATPAPTSHDPRHGHSHAHAPAATPAEITAPHVSIGTRVRSVLGRVAALCVKPVAGTTAILGKVLAFPLAERPAIIRDSAGWIAVVTLFMSICMWAAVLLRDPKPFVPAVPPVELMHTAPKEGESHGEKNAEHGEKKAEHGAKKEEGHGAKKAESHGEAKKEGHGGEAKAEGHGSGGPPASPFAKREPLIQRGGAKPAPKKKEAEGGEGHH